MSGLCKLEKQSKVKFGVEPQMRKNFSVCSSINQIFIEQLLYPVVLKGRCPRREHCRGSGARWCCRSTSELDLGTEEASVEWQRQNSLSREKDEGSEYT